MIDINRIRNNKEEVEKALLKRMDNINLDEVLVLDKEKRKIVLIIFWLIDIIRISTPNLHCPLFK